MMFNNMMVHAVIETGNDTCSVQASTLLTLHGVLVQRNEPFYIFHYSMMLAVIAGYNPF